MCSKFWNGQGVGSAGDDSSGDCNSSSFTNTSRLPGYGETVPVLWTKDLSIDLYTGCRDNDFPFK